jgi:hypothetical protein
MARILFDGALFEPIAPNAIPATEYGKLVFENAAILYPNYIPVPFEIPIRSSRGNALPHLAMIDAEYRDWWLVVVEAGEAPTLEQVIKQVEVLRTAKYSEYPKVLAERDARLDHGRLSNLLKRELPRVFMLLGHPPPPPLKDNVACIGIAELFQEPGSARRILRINGEHPTVPPELLSYCTRHTMVPAVVLELDSPEKVSQWQANESEIEIGDVVSLWRRTDETITPINACSLPGGSRFRLMRTVTGRLKIVPA